MKMHGSYRRTFGPENLAELMKNMTIQHEDYLKQDDADRKADALRYMAGYVTQYLHLVPQEKKFTFKETERVLHNSAMNIGEFDPREGSLAFCNLAKYAENLLEQPWRKDFHVIKLTSGFYVHNIAAQLQNAHEILIVMGYVNIDDTTLKLLPGSNYNKLKAVSRDCYIASQECLILSQIWQHVADQEPDYPLTIGEVFEYRKDHLGDTDTICNKLLYDIRQRMHMFKQQQQQLKYHQQQQEQLQQPVVKTSQQRFVPVERLIDYGVDDVSMDEPDCFPNRAVIPEREVDRSQEILKNMNVYNMQDEEHLYDPVYGSNAEVSAMSYHLQQQQRARHSVGQNPTNYQGTQGQYHYSSRKSMPTVPTANYNTYQKQPVSVQQQQYHNNFNTINTGNNLMMYGDPHNQRNQSMSPMIPKTVTSLFTSANTPPINGIESSSSRNNVSKSNSMNSITRAMGAASSSSSSSVSQNFPPTLALTKTKLKVTDLDAEFLPMIAPRDNLMNHQQINHDNRGTRGRKSLPASAFVNNQQSQPQPLTANNQVYPDEFYPPSIVKPVAVYGSSAINSTVAPAAPSALGANFQYYMRARQNSDNSEDVLNEAYAYASEVNQMPKGTSGARIGPTNPKNSSSKGQLYQHQATPIPQGSDSDSNRETNTETNHRHRGVNSGHREREVGPPVTTSGRSNSSTDASSSWEGSVLEGEYRKGHQPPSTIALNKMASRKSEPARRPTHIDIRSSNGRTESSSSKMRYADSSPESDVVQSQQQQQNRNKNGYRELSSSSSGGSGGSPASSSSRHYPRNEELNSLDTVYFDYLLKQGQTDEVMGREGGNVNSVESENESRERKRGSRVSSHHQNNYSNNDQDDNHIYDGRRVIPKKKQQNVPSDAAPSSSQRKRQSSPVESAIPGSSSGTRVDPNYNNLITAEITKPSHEKNLRKSTNHSEQNRERTPVESEVPSDPSPPKKPVEPWDCRFCTFKNTVEERICEICAKSKDFFDEPDPVAVVSNALAANQTEQHVVIPKLYSVPSGSSSGYSAATPVPQPSTSSGVTASEGSPEETACPQCTLLNPIRARICGACEYRLKPLEPPPEKLDEGAYDIR